MTCISKRTAHNVVLLLHEKSLKAMPLLKIEISSGMLLLK